ncbi:DUF1129 domain-containing protein [Marinilactibacillus sp. GCM10026970]|uniref:DUF1129 domain-containing protein n=1 Tax=Marinilactibacillus sp. GCM10026970 TaxID=3252642 RepID=UPI00361FBE8F
MFNKKKQEPVEQPEKIAELAAKQEENAKMREQLTNKNSEYMLKLNRSLDERGVSEERKTLIFNDMLKNIVEQQDHHLTARKIYGTVTDQANYLTENPTSSEQKEVVRSEPWKLYIDGGLLLGGMFAILSGISGMFGRGDNQAVGMQLMVLILNFVLGGFAFMIITKYAPVPGEKGGFIKYILATVLAMMGFVLFISLGALIPEAINPVIPSPITLVIGVVAIAAKWYLKRRLNIQGTMF